ncbi:MAG: hypothetical protein A2086_01745 [Spirochaetes bacterium GWD1_27_9]|nr:MAG: hypothetical protein A2Z98_03985 [Spirochaetes bacterium GWB1_27_13]OHD20607.1 MAG: hypothetical protein A2Y34_17465 [Spirochaetes bacterium GWC1_27_15]OHD41826.1 MAG: hypothetical protein A2086_01745 [Spirochaetes bacterium GWD1_27_9]
MLVANNVDYQQKLLNIIPPNLSDNDIEEIKEMLIKYFAKKAMDEMDKFWDEKNFKTDEDMEKYLNEKQTKSCN